MTVTCNLYSVHFLIENVKSAGDKWLDYLNPNSLIIKKNAKMWNHHENVKIDDRF
jgi:hypothetical protein